MGITVNDYGLTVIYEPEGVKCHKVDIVLVHGLFGHPKNSWSIITPQELQANEGAIVCEDERRKKTRTGPRELFQEVFWPQHLLPVVFPQARILVWGYDVRIGQPFCSVSKASLLHHAETLLSDLAMVRNSTLEKSKPIYFIAHSLGGIVVKDALSLPHAEKTFPSEILPATRGVIFLGTPHHGSKVASLGKIAFQLTEALGQKPNIQILRSLEENSELLELHSFREELDTKGVRIVEPFSSTIGYFKETTSTLHANHRYMAKFTSVKDVKFQRVVSVLQQWIEDDSEKGSRAETVPELEECIRELPDALIFDEEYRACLISLNYREARFRIKDVDVAYQTTYQWLLQKEVGFVDWLEGKDMRTIFWIQGKPGAGKSTLMKFALNQPATRRHLEINKSGFWILAAYFFHDRGATIQKSIEGFLGEILYQVLQQQKALFPLIYSVFNRVRDAGPRIRPQEDSPRLPADAWEIDEMQQALLLIATKSSFDVNLCLFVDALDEHDGNHRDLISLLKRLAQSMENPIFRLRLCLAGRPENVFRDAFQTFRGLVIHEHTAEDIRLYAKGRIKDELHSELANESLVKLMTLIEDIVDKAKGVFMWVRLVVDEMVEGLCEGESVEELKDLLSTIPTELKELYTRALRRPRFASASPRTLLRHRQEAYIMFQIATYAREPFGLYDFLAAALFLTTEGPTYPELQKLSTDQMHRRLNSRSSGLLEAPHSDSNHNAKVQFIHQTVNEYMSSSTGKMVICEGLEDMPHESGFLLIYRYIVSLLIHFGRNNLDVDAQRFACINFRNYAQIVDLETGNSAAHYLNILFSESDLDEEEQRGVLFQIPTRAESLDPNPGGAIHKSHPHHNHILFYVYCRLRRSLSECLSSYMVERTDGNAYAVFEALLTHATLPQSESLFYYLNVLLKTRLGELISYDEWDSLDRMIKHHLSVDKLFKSSRVKRALQRWNKLGAEKRAEVRHGNASPTVRNPKRDRGNIISASSRPSSSLCTHL